MYARRAYCACAAVCEFKTFDRHSMSHLCGPVVAQRRLVVPDLHAHEKCVRSRKFASRTVEKRGIVIARRSHARCVHVSFTWDVRSIPKDEFNEGGEVSLLSPKQFFAQRLTTLIHGLGT